MLIPVLKQACKRSNVGPGKSFKNCKFSILDLFFAESRCADMNVMGSAFTEHAHVLGFSLNLGHQQRENHSHIPAHLQKSHYFAH